MAALSSIKIKPELKLKVKPELRPCYVNCEKALFHKWIEKEDVVIKFNTFIDKGYVDRVVDLYEKQKLLPNTCEMEKIKATFAIVEFENGTVKEVNPTDIKFCDDKIKEYCFE